VRWFHLSALLVGILIAFAARAQGSDCAALGTSAELAVCESPGLRALDDGVASAYADLLKADPAGAARMDQRAWLRARDACPDQDCLFAVYDARLNELQREVVAARRAGSVADEPKIVSPAPLAEAEPAGPPLSEAEPPPTEPVETGPALTEASREQGGFPEGSPALGVDPAGATPAGASNQSSGNTSGGLGQTIFFAVFFALSALSVFVSIKVRERYDYVVFMNAWNLLYIPVIALPLVALSDGIEPPTKALFLATSGALYAFRAWQNVRNTDIFTGLLISVCQSFVALLVLALYVLSSGSKKSRRSRY
jgi:uncharacterized protein YecT (DUF1311 family)